MPSRTPTRVPSFDPPQPGIALHLKALGRAASLGLAALLPVTAWAEPLDLSRLQVFARETIRADRSDYQGPTAAGGPIALSDFDVDGNLTAGGPVDFTRGQVHGAIRAPTIRLRRVFASRSHPADAGDLARVTAELDDLGRRLACAPATTRSVVTRGALFGAPFTVLRIAATHGVDVADLEATDLASAGPNHLRVVMAGTAADRLIVRVHGDSPTLQDVGFSTQGGIGPAQIVFAFPDAHHVTIASSGGAVGDGGTPWGVPASIVAPQGDLTLAATTITGQVFAQSIGSIAGLNSGQVNRLPGTGRDGRTFSSSAAIEAAEREPAFACTARQTADER